MPIYEYQCKACGAQHEAIQKMADAPLKKCPECGKNMLQRLISAPVFRLKGGGWYETDFKSDKEAKRNLAGEEKADNAESGDKPAEKPADKSVDKPTDKPADKTVEKAGESRPAATPAAGSRSAKSRPAARAPAKKPPARKAPAKKAARRR